MNAKKCLIALALLPALLGNAHAQLSPSKHWEDAEATCKKSIEEFAPFEFIWEPGTRIFTSASIDESDSIRYSGAGIQFKTPKGDWLRIKYNCHYYPGRQIWRAEIHEYSKNLIDNLMSCQ
ncbi:MAG: hypothetical protein ISN28_15915 [Ectothiorhodospiraceae bacterium AqS1]|nr:hypothetical protein [Ectothiorhodospiraceae bacterium AqS1]